MFTGIITHCGIVHHCRALNGPGQSGGEAGDLDLSIDTEFSLEAVEIGDSIACSGVCMTVTKREQIGPKLRISMVASQVTRDCTTVGMWAPGRRINLERALAVGQTLGGHQVFGHVDGTSQVAEIRSIAPSHTLRIVLPEGLMKYVAVKGSIAVDGVSLTINALDRNENTITINLIPHSWDNTTLCDLYPGAQVNIEIDMIARYVVNYLEQSQLRE